MVWVGAHLKDHLDPNPHPGPEHPPLDLNALSKLALNSSRDRASTASLGDLFQCLTILIQNFFPISKLN